VNNLGKQTTLAFALLIVFGIADSNATAQQRFRAANETNAGSLSDIRMRDKGLVVVLKSSVIPADETDSFIIESVLRADPGSIGRHQIVYGTLARKLNSYIRKYKSLSAATDLGEADFVIFFSLVEYRQILNSTYPFGELFVIVKGEPTIQRPPRIIWKSRKVIWVGDAIDNFLRDLKTIRGED
jgi:hypothetical protein